MDKDPLDLAEWEAPPRSEDCRLWWQKLADGIAEVLSGAIAFLIGAWKLCNWRSRWWWRNGDDL